MGIHPAGIAGHTLDTSSAEKLADDLARRLHVNVELTYWPDKAFSDMLGDDFEWEQENSSSTRVMPDGSKVTEERISWYTEPKTYYKRETPGAMYTIEIEDDLYQRKKIYAQYGAEGLKNSGSYHEGMVAECTSADFLKDLFIILPLEFVKDFFNYTEGLYIHFTKNLFELEIPTDHKWGHFEEEMIFGPYTGGESELTYEQMEAELDHRRKQLWQFIKLMGGEGMYFGRDSYSNFSRLVDSGLTFDELKDEINSWNEGQIFYFFPEDEEAREFGNRFTTMNHKQRISAFYDSFDDLKTEQDAQAHG